MFSEGRDWWKWWCADWPTMCGGIDWCIRCTDLPESCTVCGRSIPAENKEAMSEAEVELHGCSGGVE